MRRIDDVNRIKIHSTLIICFGVSVIEREEESSASGNDSKLKSIEAFGSDLIK